MQPQFLERKEAAAEETSYPEIRLSEDARRFFRDYARKRHTSVNMVYSKVLQEFAESSLELLAGAPAF